MGVLITSFEPEAGEFRPVSTPTWRAVQRRLRDSRFALMRHVPTGAWHVTWRVRPKGRRIMVVADAGTGPQPALTRGIVKSLRSFLTATRASRPTDPWRSMVEDLRIGRLERLRVAQELIEQQMDMRRYVRRRLSKQSGVLADHPFFRTVNQKPRRMY